MARKSMIREFRADHEDGDVIIGGEVPEPVEAEGGPIQRRLADVMEPGYDVEDEDEVVTPGNAKVPVVKEVKDVNEAFDSLFEGMSLTEDFKNKLSLVFEAAVNESVAREIENKTAGLVESLEEQFEVKLEESVTKFSESIAEVSESIVENLDAYLDYIVKEWMEENKIAIESGIKVEMAESLMNSLKTVFYEHNISVDEETIDVVSELEEKIAVLESKTNKAINDKLQLAEEVKALKAEAIFSQLTEGLTTSQAERFRVLSEKLSFDSIEDYEKDLVTLKESFFKATPTPSNSRSREEVLVEEAPVAAKTSVSSYDSVNALANAISKIKIK